MWKLIIALLVLVPHSYALQCKISTSCDPGWLNVIQLSGITDAHAGKAGVYAYAVCCNDDPNSLSTECEDTDNSKTLAKLSDNNNAHVERGTLSNYDIKACMKSQNRKLSLRYASSCVDTEACAFSMSDTTNAHIATCGYYAANVCIATLETLSPPSGAPPPGGAGGPTLEGIPHEDEQGIDLLRLPSRANQTLPKTRLEEMRQFLLMPLQPLGVPLWMPLTLALAFAFGTYKTQRRIMKKLKKMEESTSKKKRAIK